MNLLSKLTSFPNHSGNQRLKGRELPSSLQTIKGTDLVTHNLHTWSGTKSGFSINTCFPLTNLSPCCYLYPSSAMLSLKCKARKIYSIETTPFSSTPKFTHLRKIWVKKKKSVHSSWRFAWQLTAEKTWS